MPPAATVVTDTEKPRTILTENTEPARSLCDRAGSVGWS